MPKMGKHAAKAVAADAAAEEEQVLGPDQEAEEPVNPYKDTYEWIHCIIVAIVVCVLIFVLLARVITVRGSSMLPTLVENDRIVITRLAGDYEYGDIVVLQKDSFRSEPIVKRVIGTEGQTVEINFTEGIVSVDGVPLNETYVRELTYDSYHIMDPAYYDVYGIDPETDVGEDWVKVTVPEGCLFVMGDNRNNSSDSRVGTINFVDKRDVMGKAVFRIFPLHKMGAIYGVSQSDG